MLLPRSATPGPWRRRVERNRTNRPRFRWPIRRDGLVARARGEKPDELHAILVPDRVAARRSRLVEKLAR